MKQKAVPYRKPFKSPMHVETEKKGAKCEKKYVSL